MRNFRLRFEDDCYPVWIGVRCQSEMISKLHALDATNYHVITDTTVAPLHAGALYEQLCCKVPARLWVVDDGEHCKSLATVEYLSEKMVQAGIGRNSVIVSVGGGAVGNLAGLIAALIFRGIRLVHIPTTLIAAADSVASLKQAVNLPSGKNLLGCFHKPSAVLIDLAFLRTLPAVHIRSGMFEIIKNALTVATENIPLLENTLHLDVSYSDSNLMAIVTAGLLAKQKFMEADKYERNQALVFEYGHTVGHAIELAAKGRISHGEAVGLGMIVAAEISSRLGRLCEADKKLHYRLLEMNGLLPRLPTGVTVAAVMALLRSDNKRGYVSARPDQVVMILLDGLGVPAGPVNRPLVLVDAALIQSCIVDCLTEIDGIATSHLLE